MNTQTPESRGNDTGCKVICLTKGYFTIVDMEDYERLSKWKWRAHVKNDKIVYAVRQKRVGDKQVKIYMHREIMNTPKHLKVDHINWNGLDNRRENLRNCTVAQNSQNSRLARNNTSGYKGVRENKVSGGWIAGIYVDNEYIYLGSFRKKEDAIEAYRIASLKYLSLIHI